MGGGHGNRDSVSLCHNFDGGGEGDSPNYFLQSPGSWAPHPSTSPPLISVLSIFVSLSTHSWGAFPISPPGPPGRGKGVWGGALVSMVFIYNILKKIKNLYENIRLHPPPLFPGFCPLFLVKKNKTKQTHFVQGGERGGGLAIPLTTIKLRREQVSGVAVCLSLCPELHHVGRGTEPKEGGGRGVRWLLVDGTSQERALPFSRAPPPF